jgi:ammonium transporter, Amt family
LCCAQTLVRGCFTKAWSFMNKLYFAAVFGSLLLFLGNCCAVENDMTKEAAAQDGAKRKALEKQEALFKIKQDQPEAIYELQKQAEGISPATVKADSAWMMVSTGLVLFMVPGLALFYGGMVRRKNVLGTMMQSMVALAVVGVYWIVIGYALAFGDPWLKLPNGSSLLGFNAELLFLAGVKPSTLLPNGTIPVYLHMLFQGMFAIITPALISGAVAERIRFKPYCLFLILWVTFVYCPLAHCVWAMDWQWTETLNGATVADAGKNPVGALGKLGALDFAGGTVVHIAAGFSSLAAIMLLRKRIGYPQQAIHPNSMVLTLTGAGLLWFGWFGFNGGSALASGELAIVAFAASQAAAAAAGLSWMFVEWLHRGKPTALGLASGIVAGLVAVTPASGYIFPWAGLIIGLIAGIVCYVSVSLKPVFGYDDSLDAFGVHGVGGFLGAVLTGVFCSKVVNPDGQNGYFTGNPGQVKIQLFAAVASAVVAFVLSIILVKLVDILFGFVSGTGDEILGLDRTEHGETGFDFGLAMEATAVSAEDVPRRASAPPPSPSKRFQVILDGVDSGTLLSAWSELCQPSPQIPAEFKAVYPNLTTVQGNRFQFRGGEPNTMRDCLQKLLQQRLQKPLQARIETTNGTREPALH